MIVSIEIGPEFKRQFKRLAKKYHSSDMMRKALVYVTSNWEDLIKYRNDGRFTIDNMLAERAVRPFTVKRKNSLFFSSEDGIESALKYHTRSLRHARM